jgi:DNA-binding transcriptional ArsR family regulator
MTAASPSSAASLLLTVAEPTRLRILNCLAVAPLFVSDLQAILGLPQPTISRHLQVLRRAELVRLCRPPSLLSVLQSGRAHHLGCSRRYAGWDGGPA